MALFDESSQTVALTTAAARVGIGRSLAYEQAHKVDENGDRWLMPGVKILVISTRFRVLKRDLDAVLGPLEVAS